MKKIFALLMILSIAMLVIFSGCLRKIPLPFLPEPSQDEAAESASPAPAEPESSEPESTPESDDAPDAAAKQLLDSMRSLDREQIDKLIGQYFGAQALPEEYFTLLTPISQRLSYEIKGHTVYDDKAEVNILVSAVDAQSAINSITPRAAAHLAAMQLTGKDVSNPEKILAEYAAKNIKWDEIPTIETDTTLYLIKGEDGEWNPDTSNPGNLAFANAISGGAIEVANGLKAFTDRYK